MQIIFEQANLKVWIDGDKVKITDGKDVDSRDDNEENRNYFIELAKDIIEQDEREQERKETKMVNLSDTNATKWGVSDFYEDAEKKLIEALESGESFETKGSSKKELVSFKIKRSKRKEKIDITVCQYIDEGEDLINDALCVVFGKYENWPDSIKKENEQARKTVNSIYQELLGTMIDEQIFSEARYTITIPDTKDIEKIKTALDQAFEITNAELKDNFERLQKIVKMRFNKQ